VENSTGTATGFAFENITTIEDFVANRALKNMEEFYSEQLKSFFEST